MSSPHPNGVYAVLRTADVGEAEILALLSDQAEADRLADAMNQQDDRAYHSEVTFEPIWCTAEEVVTDLALEVDLPEEEV